MEEQPIQSLFKMVWGELSNTPMVMGTYTVGLDSRLEMLMSLLDVKSNGIQVLGLHGIPGVGKTTLAKALYNKLVGHFEFRSFISNIGEISAQNNGDVVSLQNQLIRDLSLDKFPPDAQAGISVLKGIIYEKKVLIVLDDVDNINQLKALVGKREWFYEGSRIIITTRDTGILDDQFVTQFYEVRELDSAQALQLFCYHALRRKEPTGDFLNLSKQIVSLTGGLPLALEVIGSSLYDMGMGTTKEAWEDTLQKMRHIRPGHLQDVLKISFDRLHEEVKCIFLDIACLFVKMGMNREDAIDILKGCGFKAEEAIYVLVSKSLLKIAEDNTLWMHDQLRDMGRQIVEEENIVDPSMRSRLWDRDEIMAVLKHLKGTSYIQGIILDFKKRFSKDPSGVTISRSNLLTRPSFSSAVAYLKEVFKSCLQLGEEEEREVVICSEPFKPMVKLRLLQVNHVKMEGEFKYLPTGLKWLQWKGCPLKTLPSDFCPRQLAVLDLSESKIEHVWSGYSNKVTENLMVLNLYGCYNLAVIPDLSGHRKLEKLVLERCSGLIKLHASIGKVNTLLHLNLRGCSNLVEFPSDVSGMQQLETLILSSCTKLKELPEDIGSMRSLKELHVEETSISKLPESISDLAKLEKLNLSGCQYLKQLPNCIGMLNSLKELSLSSSALEKLPDSIGSLTNLEKLNLMWCRSLIVVPDSIGNLNSLAEFLIGRSSINELPASIGSLSYLKALSIGNCQSLGKLPASIDGLASIVELDLSGTSIIYLPDQIGALKSLQKLEMRNCRSLKSLPESIGSLSTLTTLNIINAIITELPESIGMLENLIILRLNECRQLHKLPASIGKLKSLHHLLMEETAVTELPETFGMLSHLMVLKMAKRPENNRATETGIHGMQEKTKLVSLPASFSNLSLLEELDARGWRISGKIPDDFEKMSSLEILKLGNNNFSSLPSSLRGLSLLKKLDLPHCEELKSLPLLPSSLQEVNLANCISLESMPDLSNLECLHELNLTNCEKVVDVPGLERLKSLRRLYLSGCNECSSAIRGRLSKVCLRNIRNLSMPGSDIPDWFSQEVTFSECKNHEIKAVLIWVVTSIDHQIPSALRDELPAIVDIRAKIVKLDNPIFSTTLYLQGVPKTDEDHVHLCRYSHFHPLVSKLKNGYKIQVIKQYPPHDEGVQLKKCGIYLLFEDDDDYCGDEESLDESQISVSEKLSRFFNSIEKDAHIS